eukprot:TRINITY_DN10066_c0_g1_i1.p1 TRINITY_DN10066_c0_g1~~TRINITY_DN10066_c0_g1_i1.p1  ORF type:complete len:234 (+),score=21.71 TRINITY_DN10066_c0_g1_i1:597-1298(+)
MDPWVSGSSLVRLSADIARGLQHLHENNLLHCDLAARNVLLELPDSGYGQPVARIADFGLSIAATSGVVPPVSAPEGWLAPECRLTNAAPSTKADIYSFGVVMWEMFSLGSDPHRRYDLAADASVPQALRRPEPHLIATCDLMHACLAADPAVRPTADDVVSRLEAIVGFLPQTDTEILSYYRQRTPCRSEARWMASWAAMAPATSACPARLPRRSKNETFIWHFVLLHVVVF